MSLSVVVPSRKEIFLQKTIDDLLKKSEGDIEIIPVLEGYEPDPPLKKDSRVRVVRHDKPKGMRSCINDASKIAKGKYFMKVDAHCCFDYGFDVKMASDCDKNWLMIPRRYSLDPDKWDRRKLGSYVDYEHFNWPYYKPPHIGLYTIRWQARRNERADKARYLIDDQMAFQGSCWFTYMDHFRSRIKRLDGDYFGMWAGEPQEIGLKTWLGGGRVVVNKKTWYAHLHKGRHFKTYSKNKTDVAVGMARVVDYWMNNRWEERKYDFEWLIDKFFPIPTWPDDWKERLNKRPIPGWREVLKINAGGA
jgi:hypothetical protein